MKKISGKLSKRKKAMVKLYATNPKITKHEAWQATHNSLTGNKDSIYSQTTQAFSNPLVKQELAKYTNLFEDTITTTVTEFKDSDEQWKRTLAVDSSKWGHDKIHGKATQKIESHSTSVNLNLDLTSITE